MTNGKYIALWTLGGIAFLLALASFTGTGTGMGRSGFMTHMLWSYVLILGILAALIVPLVLTESAHHK